MSLRWLKVPNMYIFLLILTLLLVFSSIFKSFMNVFPDKGNKKIVEDKSFEITPKSRRRITEIKKSSTKK